MPTGYATFASPNCSRSPTSQNKLMSADQPSGVRLPSARSDEHVDKACMHPSIHPSHVRRTRMRTGRVASIPHGCGLGMSVVIALSRRSPVSSVSA